MSEVPSFELKSFDNDSIVISEKIFKRKDFGIPDDAFVLCSFNNAYKISSVEFSIWMRIMYENKTCYLILLIKEERIAAIKSKHIKN